MNSQQLTAARQSVEANERDNTATNVFMKSYLFFHLSEAKATSRTSIKKSTSFSLRHMTGLMRRTLP